MYIYIPLPGMQKIYRHVKKPITETQSISMSLFADAENYCLYLIMNSQSYSKPQLNSTLQSFSSAMQWFPNS